MLPQSLHQNRYLLGQLIKRDILLRYRGAMFGVAWILLCPLLTLATFALVFGEIFQARWPQQHDGIPYWIVLFSGLIAFNIFSEALSRAPTSVRSNANYVKKLVFPVEILPVVPLCSALIHAAFNLMILAAALAMTGYLRPSFLLYPLALLPLVLLSLGCAWFLAAWGVFIKDMTQIVPPLVQIMLFMSPVLYPASAIPRVLQPIYRFNPLGAVIENCRNVAMGLFFSWETWITALAFGGLASWLGYRFFLSSREEFADAL